ncbi:hypothetical protein [Streptomyces sp. NPDC008121]|uniref:hypothetical protein n=1 Tax=Streptomyces sp. NPDC008121 TaxID=3364809 RepID=UPI0036E35828
MTRTPRRGPISWLRSLFGRRAEPDAPVFSPVTVDVPEIVKVHRESVVAFETPSKGGGFDFRIEIRCDWCAEGRLDTLALSRAVDGYQADLPQRLAERVREITRHYEPFHAQDAEQAVNEALREGECFDSGLVTCRTSTVVRPPQEIVDQQRKAALELQQIEHDYAKSSLRVRLLGEVAEEWRAFLASGLVDVGPDDESASWLTPWAVLLAERPEEAASEVSAMFRERQKQLDQFITLVGRQRKEYQAHDLFEFVTDNERQLGRAMRLFGLVPAGEPGPAVGPPEPLPQPRSSRS